MSVAGATPAQLAQLSAFVTQMRATCIAAMKLNDQVNALSRSGPPTVRLAARLQ